MNKFLGVLLAIIFPALANAGIGDGNRASANRVSLVANSTITAPGSLAISTSPTSFAPNLMINQFGIISSTTQPKVRLKMAANQAVPSGAFQAIFWDTEDYDPLGMHSLSVSSDIITVPPGGDGIYLVTCLISYGANTAGSRQARIDVNGASYDIAQSTNTGAGGSTLIQLVSLADVKAA